MPPSAAPEWLRVGMELRDDADVGAGVVCLDRRAHAGAAGADDEHVVRCFHGMDASGRGRSRVRSRPVRGAPRTERSRARSPWPGALAHAPASGTAASRTWAAAPSCGLGFEITAARRRSRAARPRSTRLVAARRCGSRSLEDRAAIRDRRHEAPGTRLAVHLGRRLRNIDVPRSRPRTRSGTRRPPAGRRGHRRASRASTLREQLAADQHESAGSATRTVSSASSGISLLRQEVARVEGRVHEVVAHPDLGLAVAHCPGHRDTGHGSAAAATDDR